MSKSKNVKREQRISPERSAVSLLRTAYKRRRMMEERYGLETEQKCTRCGMIYLVTYAHCPYCGGK